MEPSQELTQPHDNYLVPCKSVKGGILVTFCHSFGKNVKFRGLGPFLMYTGNRPKETIIRDCFQAPTEVFAKQPIWNGP